MLMSPQPKPAPKPAAPPAPARPAPKAAPAQPAAKSAPARPAPPRIASQAGAAQATRGSRLSFDLLKGIGADPTPSQSQQAPASVMSAEALAGITAAIKRQIQPCANRQVNPGPGANQIRVRLNLRLNRDGSLARTPNVVGTSGVTTENGRYEDRVKDLAVAAYVGCAPLRGLPDELYQTPKGGWGNINMNYNLP
ncbi:MAG: cell envelope biosis protein TolA [Alphaproteobacteria bacterium]|nr:cell envelope biosis protein TolA [Alphaproteobacteria bacterium]